MIFYLILILLIPFQTHPIFTAYIFGFTIIKWNGLITLIIAILARPEECRATLFSSGQGKLLFLLFGFVILSWFEGTENAPPSVQIFFSFCIFYFVTIRMVYSQKRVQLVLWAIVICILFSSLFTINEFLQFSKDYSGYYRPWGTFGDPNYFSLSAIMSLPIAYYLYKSSTHLRFRYILIGIVVIDLVAIILSTSRGAFVGLIAMLITIFSLSNKKFKTSILFVIIISIAFIAAPDRVRDRIGGTQIATDESAVGDVASTTRRWNLIVSGLKMISDHPVKGVGLGQFKSQSVNYCPNLGYDGVAHNTYIELAAELGLPSFFVFVGIILLTFRDLAWLRRHYREDHYLFLLFTTLTVSLIGYVTSATFLSGYNTKFFWLIVFLTTAYKQNIAIGSMPMQDAQ